MLRQVLVYKILLPPEWAAFQAAGRFDGSPFDQESGFIHCSARDQLAGTARRYFAGQSPLVIAAVDAAQVAGVVRWEASADGGSFPHVYGTLPLAAVTATAVVTSAGEIDDAMAI